MGLTNISKCNCSKQNGIRTNINPDSGDFGIIKIKSIGNMVVAKILYYGCTNYEGIKILVFENCSGLDINNASEIDPHFCENCKISPIARFRPTTNGWNYAVKFAKLIKK